MLNSTITRTIEAIEADLINARRDQQFCKTPTVKRTATIAVNRLTAERQNALDAMVQRAVIVPTPDPTAEKIAALEAEIAALKAPKVTAPKVEAPRSAHTTPIPAMEAPATVILPTLDVDALLDGIDGDVTVFGTRKDGGTVPTYKQFATINAHAATLGFDGIDGFAPDVTRGMASTVIKSLIAEIEQNA